MKRYVTQKRGVRHNTEADYKVVINIIVKESFVHKRIDMVKLSDAKAKKLYPNMRFILGKLRFEMM